MTPDEADGGYIPYSVRPPIPRKTRLAVERRSDVCESCGDGGHLGLHHLHYRTIGRESPEDLLRLCWDCHSDCHRDLNGDYWHDPEEMESYWDGFFSEMEKA